MLLMQINLEICIHAEPGLARVAASATRATVVQVLQKFRTACKKIRPRANDVDAGATVLLPCVGGLAVMVRPLTEEEL